MFPILVFSIFFGYCNIHWSVPVGLNFFCPKWMVSSRLNFTYTITYKMLILFFRWLSNDLCNNSLYEWKFSNKILVDLWSTMPLLPIQGKDIILSLPKETRWIDYWFCLLHYPLESRYLLEIEFKFGISNWTHMKTNWKPQRPMFSSIHIHCLAYLCAGVVLGWKSG